MNETTVTWNNQPATTGISSYATSRAGWVEWNVTDQVIAGAYYGFRIRDAAEGATTAATQAFASYEAVAHQPQLVIAFAPK